MADGGSLSVLTVRDAIPERILQVDSRVLNLAETGPPNASLSGSEQQPTVVLLHGVLRDWRSFAPILSDLQARHRVVALDFRGHGRSDPTPGAYRVIDYVADAVACIDALPGPLLLYGHSLGAMVALAACARRPERIRRAVLEDPPFSTMGARLQELPLLQYLQGVERCLFDDTLPGGGTDPSHTMAARAAHLFRTFSDIVVGTTDDGHPVRVRDQRDEPARRYAGECLAALDPEVIRPITAGAWLDGYDLDAILTTVRADLLLLQAASPLGGMLTDAEAERVEAAAGKRCRRRNFTDCGHSIHWAAPDRVLDLVRPFFSAE